MKNDLEQKQIIQKAIARAERMIRSEERLASLKAHNAPESVITYAREIVGQNMGNLVSDELAEQLLPQARNIAAMRDDRLRYLSSNTFLGSCKTRFEDLFIDFAHQGGEPDQFETNEEALDVLERAIRSGNQLTIVGTISNILDFIEQDLVYRDEELPPLPPQYSIPRS
jgi:hypothetical protein